MIRSGDFTIYNHKEYSLFKKQDGSVNLISYDSASLKEGFKQHNLIPNAYVKNLKIGDITNAYQIKTHAKYMSEEVNVSAEKEDFYYIGTTDANLAKKLGLDRTDKYYYEKWVPKEDVLLFEVKKSIIL
ncbi:hypothetical protein [Neobacillus soli]|uniref:hypothetical protein n=1 Tax=Neobacillus soli TaxID=220688 RepID=UPI00082586B7|nr:hypothetical protein [Neobacillus soli]